MGSRLTILMAVVVPALGIAAGLACQAYAADNRVQPAQSNAAPSTAQQPVQRSARYVRATQLLDMGVRNAKGVDLGEIEDLIVDVNNPRVHFAVLSFGGIMGLGDKRFAYPLRTFQVAPKGEHLALNVPKEVLKAAPGFERGTRPDWHDTKYRAEVERHFDQTVQVEPRPNMMLRPAHGLLDPNVTSREGADIGDLEDLVLDLGNGQVQYVVVDLDDKWLPDDQLAPQALKVTPERNDVTLMPDAATLSAAPTFDEERWPDFNNLATRNQFDRDLADLSGEKGANCRRKTVEGGVGRGTGSTSALLAGCFQRPVDRQESEPLFEGCPQIGTDL